MWCPPEYFHLHEVQAAWEDAARELVPYQRGFELAYLEHDETQFDYELSNAFRRFVVEGKLMELFINNNLYAAFACSHDGRIMRLSWLVVRPVIYNPMTIYNKLYSKGDYIPDKADYTL